MTLLAEALGWFVEPAPEIPVPPLGGGPRSVVAGAGAQRIAVLGSTATAPPLAAAVALACRTRAHAPTALVALWRPAGESTPVPGPAAPALPGAAAVASRLSRRGLPAAARGRLVWLPLGGVGEEAATLLRRTEAAIGDVPSVLALARPRDATVDAVLAERELLIVAAEPGSPLEAVALDDLAHLAVPTRACQPPAAGAARLAALAGLRAGSPPAVPGEVATIHQLPGQGHFPGRGGSGEPW
jgi:hypothetical protein